MGGAHLSVKVREKGVDGLASVEQVTRIEPSARRRNMSREKIGPK